MSPKNNLIGSASREERGGAGIGCVPKMPERVAACYLSTMWMLGIFLNPSNYPAQPFPFLKIWLSPFSLAAPLAMALARWLSEWCIDGGRRRLAVGLGGDAMIDMLLHWACQVRGGTLAVGAAGGGCGARR